MVLIPFRLHSSCKVRLERHLALHPSVFSPFFEEVDTLLSASIFRFILTQYYCYYAILIISPSPFLISFLHGLSPYFGVDIKQSLIMKHLRSIEIRV